MEDNKTTNEINLMDILIAIWGWIVKAVSATVKFIGEILRLLFRHKVLTAILLVVCLGISQYFARTSNRMYHADGMAILHGTNAKTVKEIGNQLSVNSPRFEETSLSRKLNLPDSITKKIAGVGFYHVIDYKTDSIPDVVDFNNNHSLEDTLNVVMKDYLYIRLTVMGTKNVDVIGNAVLDYINNNPVVKSEFEMLKKGYVDKIKVVELEDKRIDSLAFIKYFEKDKPNIQFQNNQLLIGNQATQLFYGDRLFLQRLKSEAEAKIAEAKAPVVIPSGFILNPRPINGRMTNGIKGLFAGIFLSLLLAFVAENYKKWIDFLSQNK